MDNLRQHAFKIAKHLGRWKSHSREPRFSYISVPPRIALRAIATIMRLAINLNRKPSL